MPRATINKISIQGKAKSVIPIFVLVCFAFMQIGNVYLNTAIDKENTSCGNHKKCGATKKHNANEQNDEEENENIKAGGLNEDFLIEDNIVVYQPAKSTIETQIDLQTIYVGNNYAFLHAQPPDERNS